MPIDAEIAIWTAIVNTASAFAAAGGLYFVAYQLKLLREAAQADRVAMQASIDGQVYTRIDTINGLLIAHPEVAEGLNEPFNLDNKKKADPVKDLADMFFTVIEQLYKQRHFYKCGEPLISDEQWKAWERTIAHNLRLEYLASYWQQCANENYEPGFRDFMFQMVGRRELYKESSEQTSRIVPL